MDQQQDIQLFHGVDHEGRNVDVDNVSAEDDNAEEAPEMVLEITPQFKEDVKSAVEQTNSILSDGHMTTESNLMRCCLLKQFYLRILMEH